MPRQRTPALVQPVALTAQGGAINLTTISTINGAAAVAGPGQLTWLGDTVDLTGMAPGSMTYAGGTVINNSVIIDSDERLGAALTRLTMGSAGVGTDLEVTNTMTIARPITLIGSYRFLPFPVARDAPRRYGTANSAANMWTTSSISRWAIRFR